ncbi:LytTR family DNA-binding domain-containing protein [Proteiniphilum sp.]|uniref:LytR/AlgR family response regulator transcription factor n=1 Tax=Proteiniphilum sp. TaxID=1926877 RepID=UPI002B20A3B4|nr:LytTR family DNA-binding domain-containing protein [Proteiniphilum sp.]MEA4917199.1 LytTR family DNA-binding domain-containing protein [Proteiniphilum sp.]
MILNCWIVDDEPLALSLLESYVQKTSFLKLTGKYSNALSAMKHLAGERVDLLFLDIQMPDVNGMEFARIIGDHTRIIFTTAFSEYALEGYKVSALDYLLKPFSFADFLVAAKKALNWFEMTDKKQGGETAQENLGIFVKSDYKLLHVLYDDILYIEGLKDYVKIYTESQSKPILSLISLKTLEEDLPTERFMRVHRSYIIHKNKISSINKRRIIIGEKQIPMGDTYRKQFMSIIGQ